MGNGATNNEMMNVLDRIAYSMYVRNMISIYKELHENGCITSKQYEEMLLALADNETEKRD